MGGEGLERFLGSASRQGGRENRSETVKGGIADKQK